MVNEKFPVFYGNIHIRVLGKSDCKSISQGQIVSDSFTETRNRIGLSTNHPVEKIFSVKQVHGNSVLCTSDLTHHSEEEGDGLYCKENCHLLYVKTADCVPLFFWSKKYPVYGVIHAGWRGAQSEIAEIFFRKIAQNKPEINDWNFFFGPSISMKNYVIQEDVAKFFQNAKKSLARFEEGYRLGVKEYLIEKLLEFSPSLEFHDSGICTYENTEFFSHRRKDSGRNLNLIWSSI